jgi:upstream activation factor subunit UAF30
MATIESLQSHLQDLEKLIKAVQKETRRIRQKLEDPTGEKAKARSENNSFKKPLQVSDKLKTFLGLAQDETISRSEVTKRISAYAKENGLTEGKNINMNDALKDLLNPPADVKVSIMNIQRYLNHHYVPAASAAAAAPTATTPAQKGKPKVKA